MPLLGSLPEAADLPRGKGALDETPQGVGLGWVRLNVLPAATAAASLAAGNDALLALQAVEFAVRGGIDAAVHVLDQLLLRREGYQGLVFLTR
jgi:hypothetical protein